MVEKNKYGLSRSIPAGVKREIRKNCGFGCVVCGLAIIEYEHIDPEFSDAKEHDPGKMTLLCGSCHSKVTRKIWSKEKIKKHAQKPKCLEMGYASDFFEIGEDLPVVVFGSMEWVDPSTIIEAFGETVLGFTIDREAGMLQISGIFHNDDDQEIFRIEENEWKGLADNFDIEVVGNTLTIRKEYGTIALRISVEPPKKFIVEQIDMVFRGAQISGTRGKGFEAIAPDGSTITVSNIKAESCVSGLHIDETSVRLGYRCKKLQLR